MASDITITKDSNYYLKNILQYQQQKQRHHHWHANSDQTVEEAQSSSSASSLTMVNAINKMSRHQEQLTSSRHRIQQFHSWVQTIESLCTTTIQQLWRPTSPLSSPVVVSLSSSLLPPTTTTPTRANNVVINNTCEDNNRDGGGGGGVVDSSGEVTRYNNYGLVPCKNDCDIAKCRRPNHRLNENAITCTGTQKLYQTSDFSKFAPERDEDIIKRRKISLGSSFIVGQCTTMIYIFLMYLSMYSCMAARQEASSSCTFPSRWEGSWFQSGVPQPIYIKGSTLSIRGKCVASDGDKFLLVNDKGCHRCVVIYEKHKNVLQYKESECQDMYQGSYQNPAPMPMRSILKSTEHNSRGAHPNMNGHSRLSSSDQFLLQSNDDSSDCPGCRQRETLQYLCEQIPGDALLFSMFRENSEPVKCPLKGPFTFTYSRGHGDCKNPVSNIESCTEDSRLLLNFQACPDVAGTESTVEELTCLATWKDGNSRYLVGLVSHHHATSNEERFRCFVYGKPQGEGSKDAEYKLAQSGDATCNGLESAEIGSRMMTLRKPPSIERCDFPTWFKGPRHWHALMGSAGYVFHPSDGSMHILKQTGYMETRALCEQINKQTTDEMQAVVHYTTGCKSGFMCMMFHRRDTHVAEIQMGKQAKRVEDACAPDHFDPSKMPYVTLLATNAEPSMCPLTSSYRLKDRIGPPFMVSRHKRNHHDHHHAHRHGTLSFRNQDELIDEQWRLMGRSLSPRHRRDTGSSYDDGRDKRQTPSCVVDYNAARRLRIGCTRQDVIDVEPGCPEQGEEEYVCHGQWQENTTTFIVAKHSGSSHGVCITLKQNVEGTSGQLVVGDSCHRATLNSQASADKHLVANLTQFGTCSDTNAGPILMINVLLMLVLAIIITHR